MKIVTLEAAGQVVSVKPVYALKVFKLTGFQVINLVGVTPNRQVELSYRYSFTTRKWSAIEPLTLANIRTIKIDPLSFFYIEIFCKRIGSDQTGVITIEDIVFQGDIQNITDKYKLATRFGFRSDCDYGDDSCLIGVDPTYVDVAVCEPTFKPYEAVTSVAFQNLLANQVSDMFGWDVDYYRVEPDENGTDHLLHENGLFKFTKKATVKILVPKNKFPESVVQFNMFDLGNFESFTVHITKDEFKKVFGAEKRPAEMDRLFICQINKYYKVTSAQGHREFMNSSIYYQVVLAKAEDDETITGMDEMEGLSSLIHNNSLDNLVGNIVNDNVDLVALKPTQERLTEDRIRQALYAPVRMFELTNGDNVISRSYYDLSANQKLSISYLAHDNVVVGGDTRSFSCWFSMSAYKSGSRYNLLDNLDNTGKGYSFDIVNGQLHINWMGEIRVGTLSLSLNKWYGIIINVNQRQHTLTYHLYERNEPSVNTTLHLVNTGLLPITPTDWTGDTNLKIYGSSLLITNVRLFDDIIPTDSHVKSLNQYNVKASPRLILGDNADRQVISPSHRF